MRHNLLTILLVLLLLNSTFLIYSVYTVGESQKQEGFQVTQLNQPQLSLEYLSGKSEKEIKEWYDRNKTISVTYQDSSMARTRTDSVLKLVEEKYPFLQHSFY